MKKVLMSLIWSFGLIYLFSFRCHAVSIGSIESIEQGLQSLELGGLYDSGVAPYGFESNGPYSGHYINVINQVAGKQTSTSLSSSDFTIYSEIPFEVYDEIKDWSFKDENGNNLIFSSLSYATFDNGYYSGSCILDSNGDIVYRWNESLSESKRVCDIKHGGSIVSSQEWASIYDNVALSVQDQGYNYSMSDTSEGFDSTFYLVIGMADNWYNPEYAESVFINNQYVPGLIVPGTSQNGSSITYWLTNDLSLIQHTIIVGDSTDTHFDIESGTFNKGAYSYSYRVSFWETRDWSNNRIEGSLSEFLDGAQINSPVLARVGYTYDNSLYSDTIPFNPTDGTVFSVGLSHALDDVLDGIQDWVDTAPVNNPAFDPDQNISVGNYPVVIPGDTIASDPSIPVESNPAIELDPSISYPLEDEITIPSVNGFDIPIISDLQYRFPFSIPWDLKNMLKGLRSSAVAPRFQGDLYIAPIDYTYHIDINLSMFDEQAQLFRLLFLIGFIIALARFSYTHFFGT